MQVDGAERLDPLLAADPAAGQAGPGHRDHLHVPGQLGRVLLGADHHQHARASARCRLAIALFQGQNSTLWGLVFAASIIAIVPVIIVFLVFQRYFVQGLTSGAVKG